MVLDKEKSLRDEIIDIGKKLYALHFIVARAGNLSARLDEKYILITATGTNLGNLNHNDIIKVDLTSESNHRHLSTEFPLHSLVYKNFPQRVIIHCHPPLTNAYFAIYKDLKVLTFETKLFLGDIPVIEQETPAITNPELVTLALKSNNLAVIKNHGVVSIADNFNDALYLIEELEEAVKIVAVARLFKKEILDDLDKELKQTLIQDTAYPMFSPGHIQAIVDLVNKDEFVARKGQELDLTLKMAIKMDGLNKIYKFNFEKGYIRKLEFDEDAPFVISAPPDVWEMIFLGKLDPFVATTQGKMKLKGDLGKLSRWYVPFSRVFELFKQVKIK